jgi:hypothetical protein
MGCENKAEILRINSVIWWEFCFCDDKSHLSSNLSHFFQVNFRQNRWFDIAVRDNFDTNSEWSETLRNSQDANVKSNNSSYEIEQSANWLFDTKFEIFCIMDSVITSAGTSLVRNISQSVRVKIEYSRPVECFIYVEIENRSTHSNQSHN